MASCILTFIVTMFLINIISFNGREEMPPMQGSTKIFRETFSYCCYKYMDIHKDPIMFTFGSPEVTCWMALNLQSLFLTENYLLYCKGH